MTSVLPFPMPMTARDIKYLSPGPRGPPPMDHPDHPLYQQIQHHQQMQKMHATAPSQHHAQQQIHAQHQIHPHHQHQLAHRIQQHHQNQQHHQLAHSHQHTHQHAHPHIHSHPHIYPHAHSPVHQFLLPEGFKYPQPPSCPRPHNLSSNSPLPPPPHSIPSNCPPPPYNPLPNPPPPPSNQRPKFVQTTLSEFFDHTNMEDEFTEEDKQRLDRAIEETREQNYLKLMPPPPSSEQSRSSHSQYSAYTNVVYSAEMSGEPSSQHANLGEHATSGEPSHELSRPSHIKYKRPMVTVPSPDEFPVPANWEELVNGGEENFIEGENDIPIRAPTHAPVRAPTHAPIRAPPQSPQNHLSFEYLAELEEAIQSLSPKSTTNITAKHVSFDDSAFLSTVALEESVSPRNVSPPARERYRHVLKYLNQMDGRFEEEEGDVDLDLDNTEIDLGNDLGNINDDHYEPEDLEDWLK
jgi:hypothetical protein